MKYSKPTLSVRQTEVGDPTNPQLQANKLKGRKFDHHQVREVLNHEKQANFSTGIPDILLLFQERSLAIRMNLLMINT
jgi:hypothetical protein